MKAIPRSGPARPLLFALALVLLASPITQAATHEIEIYDNYFTPAGTVVAPGDTVRWTLRAGTHTTTSDAASPRSWDSGPLSVPGETFTLVFGYADGPGPFPYHCALHPEMTDTVFVAEECAAAAALEDGVPLSVAAMIAGVRIVGGSLPPPDNLYQLDLTGDCYVDAFDLARLNCYFTQGLVCFDLFPVPTCCFPELIVSDCAVPITGDLDVSRSLSAADIILGVGFVFRGSDEPPPCAAVADVDCSGEVTASDLVYLVAHIFKGGPLPCDVCTLFPDVWDCP